MRAERLAHQRADGVVPRSGNARVAQPRFGRDAIALRQRQVRLGQQLIDFARVGRRRRKDEMQQRTGRQRPHPTAGLRC